MKKKRGITQGEFIAYHEGLKKQLLEVKKLLRKAQELSKPIAKKAYKLCELGNRFYVKSNKGFCKPAFEELPSMVEDFKFWWGIDNDIKHIIENI